VFYEVKFRKSPVSRSMIEEKIAQVDRSGLECYKYVFFSKSGFEGGDIDNVKKIEIEALFE
jgi:hypothetical protein